MGRPDVLQGIKIAAGYGRIPIVHGVSLSVEQGESLGIVGHNGMGKSTLLKTIAGVLPMSGGSLRFKGVDIGAAPAFRRARLGLGYVPQGRMIFPNLTVRENLGMGAVSAARPDAVIEEALDDFPQLTPLLSRPGGVLSGGEQQLLALARCLCGRPDLILLDEPTEGVQPSLVEDMVVLLHKLKARRRLTIILVEQKLSFLQSLADRLLVLQRGLIRAELDKREASDSDLVERLLNTGQATSREDA